MKHQIIVTLIVIGCMFLGGVGYAADGKTVQSSGKTVRLTAEQQTILRQEFENIGLKIQLMQGRQREIAAVLAPYVAKATTAGVKAAKKGKK
jgi:hypothetical protein